MNFCFLLILFCYKYLSSGTGASSCTKLYTEIPKSNSSGDLIYKKINSENCSQSCAIKTIYNYYLKIDPSDNIPDHQYSSYLYLMLGNIKHFMDIRFAPPTSEGFLKSTDIPEVSQKEKDSFYKKFNKLLKEAKMQQNTPDIDEAFNEFILEITEEQTEPCVAKLFSILSHAHISQEELDEYSQKTYNLILEEKKEFLSSKKLSFFRCYKFRSKKFVDWFNRCYQDKNISKTARDSLDKILQWLETSIC